jgi:hypothetical protein
LLGLIRSDRAQPMGEEEEEVEQKKKQAVQLSLKEERVA